MKKAIVAITLLLGVITSIRAFYSQNKKEPLKPENIIVMIADGMGVGQISAARFKNNGQLNLDRFNNIGLMSINLNEKPIGNDAINSTAIACGVITKKNQIGVNKQGENATNLFEIAQDKGLKTALISTASVTDATPASFTTHNIDALNQFETAKQLCNANLDMVIGGGSYFFFN
ncbi:MAG: alkaline phosphatase, partial [Bacteroidia bacterium]